MDRSQSLNQSKSSPKTATASCAYAKSINPSATHLMDVISELRTRTEHSATLPCGLPMNFCDEFRVAEGEVPWHSRASSGRSWERSSWLIIYGERIGCRQPTNSSLISYRAMICCSANTGWTHRRRTEV